MEKKWMFTAELSTEWTLVNTLNFDMIAHYEISFDGCDPDEAEVSILKIEPNSSNPTAIEGLIARELNNSDHSLLISDIEQHALTTRKQQLEDLNDF